MELTSSASTSPKATLIFSGSPFSDTGTYYDASHGLYIDVGGITNVIGAQSNPIPDASSVAITDGQPPVLPTVTVSSGNTNTTLAKTGDVVTLTFTSSETINTPTVTIAGHVATVLGSLTNWTASTTMLIGDTEGAVPFTIDFTDLAANSGTQVTAVTSGYSATFDRTAPTIGVTTTTVTSNPATVTGTIDDATATISINVGNVYYNATNNGNGTWTAFLSGSNLSNGTYDVEASSTDPVGNIGTDATTAELAFATAGNGVAVPPPGLSALDTLTLHNTSGISDTTGDSKDTRGVTQSNTTVSPVSLIGPLGFGKTSNRIKTLQQILSKYPEIYPEAKITGYYGPLTLKAVEKFQCKNMSLCAGSPSTNGYGLAGPKTRAKIMEVVGR